MTVWRELVGQHRTVRVLQTAAAAARDIVEDRPVRSPLMAHAWLFTGPAGSGRSVAARAFAAALQCDTADDLGCGHCAACRAVRSRNHPDVRSIVPEGLSIGVNEMRAVVAIAARRPALGRWQVVVIEDADRLTEQAANALLKAVEEPAPRTVFLLCAPSTHPDDVSVTLRSRSRLVSLRIPPASAVEQVLLDEGVDRADARWAAAAGQGHVGRSRRLARDTEAAGRRRQVLRIPASLTSMRACLDAAEQLIVASREESAALSSDLDAGELEQLQNAWGMGATGRGAAAATRGMAGAVKELERKQKSRATRTQRDAIDRALVDLAAFYRDVLLHHAGSEVVPAHPDFAADVRAVAAVTDSVQVLGMLDAVLACRESLELNVKPEIALTALTTALRLPARRG